MWIKISGQPLKYRITFLIGKGVFHDNKKTGVKQAVVDKYPHNPLFFIRGIHNPKKSVTCICQA
jgi:hypothetical protein